MRAQEVRRTQRPLSIPEIVPLSAKCRERRRQQRLLVPFDIGKETGLSRSRIDLSSPSSSSPSRTVLLLNIKRVARCAPFRLSAGVGSPRHARYTSEETEAPAPSPPLGPFGIRAFLRVHSLTAYPVKRLSYSIRVRRPRQLRLRSSR